MNVIKRLKRAFKELQEYQERPRKSRLRPTTLEEQVFMASVNEGDVVFDIGANKARVAVFVARLAGPKGTCIAFEPVWPSYIELCKNVQVNTFLKAPIITIPFGLAETNRNALINVPKDKFYQASMAPATAWREVTEENEMISYDCQFMTLDEFIKTRPSSIPAFIKIDVEGAEILVLQGARDFFLGGHRPIIYMEVVAPQQRAFGYGPWDLYSLLMSYGYSFLFVCPEGLIDHMPSADRPFPHEFEIRGYNTIAYVPGKHDAQIRAMEYLRIGSKGKRLPMPAPLIANRLS